MNDDELRSKLKGIKSELESEHSNQRADLDGDGAVAQGSGTKAVGRDGILIEGSVYFGSDTKPPSPVDDKPARGEPPFKGLQYFDVADASLFFGRANLTNILLDHIRAQRFLVVVGASGSGKSSVVRAGVVATLQSQPGWRIQIVTPTARPLETLALALTSTSESVSAAKTLREDMRRDAESLYLYTRRLMADNSKARMLLVVDQFEELFTLCHDPDEREAYVNNLMTAVSEERKGPLTIILTIRADFYHYCMQLESLISIPKYQINIGAMTTDELRQAIVGPAESCGWEFESGLVDLILRDVSQEPGALPLLSHALLATWARRRGHTMTLAGYSEAGGVHGAVAKTAEDTYQSLSADQKEIARRIFLRLTELGEGTQDTRRRVSLDELESDPTAKESEELVLRVLADARLVTTDKESVEVAHEALIREWRTLRSWLDEDRAALRVHRHLTETALGWEHNDRDPGDLYRGIRLAQALEWAKTHASDMSPLEAEYLKACRNALEKERWSVRVRWATIVGVLLFAFVLVVMTSTGQLRLNLTSLFPPLSTQYVVIPAGAFIMGSDPGPDLINPDELPAHMVILKAFAINQYEVTNQEYYQCVKAGVCSAPRNDIYKNSEYAQHPVTDVSWFDADNYCKWIGKRLPSEAEWERAARGAQGYEYPWGDKEPNLELANYNGGDKAVGGTTPVGNYPKGANAYALYDMAGNVWEWVEDWYDPNAYARLSVSNPSSSDDRGFRVIRGGSWFSQDVRSAMRGRFNPSYMGYDIGFRCAGDLK